MKHIFYNTEWTINYDTIKKYDIKYNCLKTEKLKNHVNVIKKIKKYNNLVKKNEMVYDEKNENIHYIGRNKSIFKIV